MQRNFLLSLLSIILLSCHTDPKEKLKAEGKPDTAGIVKPNQSPESITEREKIILELNKFSDAVAKKDKSVILSFFDFPLADSTVNFFEVDSVFDAQRSVNNGAITEKMFDKSFNTIYDRTDMIEFNNLFNHLNTNDLEKKDKIDFANKVKNDGCYYLYSIQIKNNEIYISYGTNSNDDYRKRHPDEEEICDEYAQMWTFKFENNKMKFLKHRIAG